MRNFTYILAVCLLGHGAFLSGQARINEVLADNSFDTENPFTGLPGDWVELHNPGTEAYSLLAHFLSDDRENLAKWAFPSGLSLEPGQYLVLLADGTGMADSYLHLNFKLEVEGETLYLYSPTLGILDSLAFPRQYSNDSYGRTSDGEAAFFDKVTPGEANDQTSTYQLAPPPAIDQPGGVYPDGLQVSFSADPEGRVRYTLDGSIPEFGDAEYNGQAISITETTVLRARQWINGVDPGETVTATYVVHPGHNLPVAALATAPDNLWDDYKGIYVIGKNGISGNCVDAPRNWNQDWEVSAHMEYFGWEGRVQLAKNGGIKIHGGCSRTRDLKSLAFITRNSYGAGPMEYVFFSTSEADNYKSIIFRNAGNDFGDTYIRDAAIMSSVRGLDVDQQEYQPVVLYLNGEYWGILNMREKANEHWVATNYGYDPDSIDFLENGSQVFAGSSYAWDELMSYMQYNNLGDEEHYAWVAERLDIHSYIDYLATQFFYANRDWPGNNQKCWRLNTGDGKWRFLMYDLEFSLGLYDSPASFNMFTFATADDVDHWPNPTWSTLPIRSLFQNQGFRDEFIGRYLALLNTSFSADQVIHVIDSLQAGIYDEFAAHASRWNGVPNLSRWEIGLEEVREFVRQRPGQVINNMRNYFGLGQAIPFHVASTDNKGRVLLNGVVLPSVSGGFSGTFLSGAEMKLQYEDKSGYSLKHWEVTTVQGTDTLLLPRNSDWRYLDSGNDPGAGWMNPDFNDSAWPQGAGELGYGEGDELTELNYGGDSENKYLSYYFRHTLSLQNAASFENMKLELLRDDGAVVYVNGKEALRVNMPSGEISHTTTANNFVGGEDEYTYFSHTLAPALFSDGDNVIAVEIHQSSPTSSDISFDLEISGYRTENSAETRTYVDNPLVLTPGKEIQLRAITEKTELDLDLRINELMSFNRDAHYDEQGTSSDWIEVYNAGNETVDMAGLWFTDSLGVPLKCRIPTGHPDETRIDPGEFMIFFASGRPEAGPRHLDFRLDNAGEEIGLCYLSGSATVWVDSLSYDYQLANRSSGAFPDGADTWLPMAASTPGQSNLYTSVPEAPASSMEVRLYPNPTRSLLHLEIQMGPGVAEDHHLEILDLAGRCVLAKELPAQGGLKHHTLDLSPLEEGLYILQIASPSGRQSFRIVKGN